MTTKREELQREYLDRLERSNGSGYDELATILAELAERLPERAEPGEPAPAGKVVMTELEREMRGWELHVDARGIALDLLNAARRDQLEAVRRAREADGKRIAELERKLENLQAVHDALDREWAWLFAAVPAGPNDSHPEHVKHILYVIEQGEKATLENVDLRRQVERLTGERDALQAKSDRHESERDSFRSLAASNAQGVTARDVLLAEMRKERDANATAARELAEVREIARGEQRYHGRFCDCAQCERFRALLSLDTGVGK